MSSAAKALRHTLKLTDTMTGTKKSFEPSNPDRVTIYCCGPTVYGYTHVGNARAALTLDLVTRVLTYAGYKVESARNFTDVDDKIIAAAAHERKTPADLARFYEDAYVHELQLLEALAPTHTPRATETISDMISFIEELIAAKKAYPAKGPDGTDVYYRVTAFEKYGCLSKRKLDDMIAGARIEPGESKEHPGDFALWKAAKPLEPSWLSPWGAGRPGWHIECSAMIRSCFGDQLDIHMGGLDLIFPHHENEIAQSQGLTNKPLAKYWLHNGMIEVGKEKMSKSIGNILRTQEFIDLYGAETFRILVLSQHYRSPMDLSKDSILRAEALIERLYHAKQMVEASGKVTGASLSKEFEDLSNRVDESLFDDFNTAKALGLILSALRVCYRDSKPETWAAWQVCLPVLNQVFGILNLDAATALKNLRERKLKRAGISESKSLEIEQRLKQREEFRKQKNFAESDRVREDLEKEGIVVMDGPDGTAWSAG